MRRVFAVGCCVFALATASCAAIFGFDRLTEGPLGPDAEAMDATTGGPTDGGPSPDCLAVGYPANTATVNGDGPEILGALRTLDFGIDASFRDEFPSYNLDRTCTVSPATSSCIISPATAGGPSFGSYVEDNDGGGDNAGFALLSTLGQVPDTSLTQAGINKGIAEGLYGAVLRLQGWNGTPNDAEVVLSVFAADGFGDGTTRPTFTRADSWRLDARYRTTPNVADVQPSQKSKGYVTGGMLVARFDSLALEMKIADDPKPFDVILRDAVITGNLDADPNGAGFLAGGIVAGRWATADFLGQVRSIYILNGSGAHDATICRDNPSNFYGIVRQTVCGGRDIRGDLQDNANLPCTALSIAARIEGYRVDRLGTFVDPGDFRYRCDGGGPVLEETTKDCDPP